MGSYMNTPFFAKVRTVFIISLSLSSSHWFEVGEAQLEKREVIYFWDPLGFSNIESESDVLFGHRQSNLIKPHPLSLRLQCMSVVTLINNTLFFIVDAF